MQAEATNDRLHLLSNHEGESCYAPTQDEWGGNLLDEGSSRFKLRASRSGPQGPQDYREMVEILRAASLDGPARRQLSPRSLSRGFTSQLLSMLVLFFRGRELAENKFCQLADQWERETRNLSSLSMKFQHPAYLEIIGMGHDVVPLILKRMRRQPAFWFDALHRITKTDPISPSIYGNIQAMTEAWLNWGVKNGQIKSS